MREAEAALVERRREAEAARAALEEAETAAVGAERDRAGAEAVLAETLAEAFGPDGIPAMVFAGVVAELEADAAEVLEELSEGRLRLTIETRRAVKTRKGAEAETLDRDSTGRSGAGPTWSGFSPTARRLFA